MIRTLSCALLLGLTGSLGATDSALSPEQAKLARQLVGQLSNPSFRVREDASARLVKFGRAVEPILRQGLASKEAETRLRCQRLLPLAMRYGLEIRIRDFLADPEGAAAPLAGWARLQKLAGSDEDARDLFVDLHRLDPEFMET